MQWQLALLHHSPCAWAEAWVIILHLPGEKLHVQPPLLASFDGVVMWSTEPSIRNPSEPRLWPAPGNASHRSVPLGDRTGVPPEVSVCVLCSRSLCLASLMPQMNAVALAFTKAIAGALWAVLLGPNMVWSQRRYFKEGWGGSCLDNPCVIISVLFVQGNDWQPRDLSQLYGHVVPGISFPLQAFPAWPPGQ